MQFYMHTVIKDPENISVIYVHTVIKDPKTKCDNVGKTTFWFLEDQAASPDAELCKDH